MKSEVAKTSTERCKCEFEFPIVLQHQLTENPIVCSNCNLDRELHSLSDDLNNEIVKWNKEYGIAYKSWLDSDNNIDELSNPASNLNELGLRITLELNNSTRTYYWWHVNENEKYNQCPQCKGKLVQIRNVYSDFHKVCDKCKILIKY